MTSKRELVLAAVKTMIATALPYADVRRNVAKASSVGAGGSVFLRDGDLDDIGTDLSPLTYNYAHRIPVEIAAFPSTTLSKEAVVDQMTLAIGNAIEADRTLGGLCEYLEAEPPTTDDLDVTGSKTGFWAEFAIVAYYASHNPLT
jgi:hypothetical protein